MLTYVHACIFSFMHVYFHIYICMYECMNVNLFQQKRIVNLQGVTPSSPHKYDEAYDGGYAQSYARSFA